MSEQVIGKDNKVKFKIKLRDGCDTSPTYKQEIPCTVEIDRNEIMISADGYEDNMSCCLEYYDSKLQVLVWGKQSLHNGGDIDMKYIITDNYESFKQDIEQFYQD